MIILNEGDKSKAYKGPFTCPECGCQFLLTKKEYVDTVRAAFGHTSAGFYYRNYLNCPNCENIVVCESKMTTKEEKNDGCD